MYLTNAEILEQLPRRVGIDRTIEFLTRRIAKDRAYLRELQDTLTSLNGVEVIDGIAVRIIIEDAVNHWGDRQVYGMYAWVRAAGTDIGRTAYVYPNAHHKGSGWHCVRLDEPGRWFGGHWLGPTEWSAEEALGVAKRFVIYDEIPSKKDR